MDDNCSNDGVYAGRYVLVEYDSQLSSSDYDKSWYLVTDVDGKHIPYGSISSCKINQNNFYLYFNGPDATTSQLATDLQEIELKIIYFDKYKHFTISNSRPIYIKVKRDGSYNTITWDQFKNHYNYQASENGIINSNIDDLEADNIIHAHIANGIAHIEDTSLFEDNNTEIYAVVLPGAAYTYNVDPEWWTIQDTTFNLNGKTYAYLNQVPNDSSSNYLANFNIDQGRYHTARGYDSTVWQKVYSNGVEKYVMIAELNTIVPTFGVSSDPPSLLPISPHFGADSTNVYYELHWQPNWGFRIKAANNELMIPKVNPNGQLDLTDQNNLQSQYASINARNRDMDDVYYPSDQLTRWQQTFEDNTLDHDEKRKTLYFDPDSQKWGTDSGSQIPSAIYFNRSGFNSNKIAYSKDLISEESRTSSPSWNRFNPTVASSGWANEDNITLSPTGLSGNVYNLHDGSADLKPQADTQELSIMLPTIGDTIAHVWDLVYGGRNTTKAIASTNTRNKDIAWEDAKGEPARRGLRLTGIDGDEYNTAQVDTIAGAINTAHDLLGMIISSNTTEELSNPDELDNNRIYYDSERHQYFRKHKTYEYTEVPDDFFIYQSQNTSNLNQELIDSGLYYVWDETLQEYVVATVYDPTKQYFLKQSKEQYTLIEGKLVDFPYGDYKWYRDYLSENSAIMNDIPTDQQEAKSDYILNSEYQDGRDYYRVDATEVALNSSYEPEKYWYKTKSNDRQQLVLDLSDQRQKDTTYYTVDTSRLYSLKTDRHFAGVYVPGVYYFKRKNGTFELDLSDYQTCNGEMSKTIPDVELETDAAHNGQFKYYLLNIIKSYDTTGQEVLYRRSYDYQAVTNLTETTFINDTYYIKNGSEYTIAHEYDSSIRTYYLRQVTYIKIEDNSSVELEVLEEFYNEELVVYQVGTYFLRDTNSSGELRSFTEITRADFLNDQSIYNKEVWVFGERENPTIPPFVTLDEAIAANDVINRQDSFYQENTYHYLKNGSYILDTALSITPGRQYYLINPIKLEEEVTYYQAGTYYVESEAEDEYELAIDIEKPDGNIYQKEDYYVIADSRNILPKGTKWNPDAAAIPDEITLGTRKDKWEIINIPDYSKTMGTLNGMILQMYQIIEPYDKLTRSNDNVSGVINQVKDIIARFESLKSREVVVVDDYGRAHSASIATLQHSSYNQEKITARDMVDSITLDKYPEASTVGSMQHRWITAVVDGNPEHPQLTIHHNFQPVTDTQSWLNKNGDTLTENSISLLNTDNISLYTPIVDGMGHVVGHDTKIVTLPYSFKFITTDAVSTAVTDLTHTAATIAAKNTQDTITFKSANIWTKLSVNAADGSVTFGHLVRAIDIEDDDSSNFDETDSNDQINIQHITYDEAGHIRSCKSHQYTLPYSFKTFTHNNTLSGVTDLVFDEDYSPADHKIIATTVVDSFNFMSQNKWIRLQADGKTLKLSHLVNNFEPSTSSNSLSSETTGITTFTTTSIEKDEAGHLTALDTKTLTMPNSFGKIALSAASTNNTNELISNTTDLEADCTHDTLTFAAGDRWILLAGDADNDKITIGHASPDNIYLYDKGQTANASLNYGGTFKVVHPKADKYGHIGSLDEYTITLPSISLTEATNTSTANVLTGITLNTSTGAIGYTQKNVSELQLTNFSYNSSSQSNADLITGDTINGALAKLQKKIYDETTATIGARDVAINAAIQSLDSSLTNSEMGKTLTGITITDGKITNSTFGNISITSSQVSDLSTTINGVITTALNGLTSSATGTLGTGNTITTLTQSNGKVSYTVSAISITSDQVSNFAITSNSLIENKINNLNANNSITSGQYHLLTSLSESNGIISYTSEVLSWNHISTLLPTSGDDVLLTVGNANSTYANISIETNAYTDDTVFDYSESYHDENENEDINYLDGTETELTIQQLVAKVKELERRIGELENPNP